MKGFLGEMNIKPPLCSQCGGRHEPQYPHEATEQFRKYIRRVLGRNATAFDLVSHTKGLMREALMSELLRKMEV